MVIALYKIDCKEWLFSCIIGETTGVYADIFYLRNEQAGKAVEASEHLTVNIDFRQFMVLLFCLNNYFV
jgi:hypothetical protein